MMEEMANVLPTGSSDAFRYRPLRLEEGEIRLMVIETLDTRASTFNSDHQQQVRCRLEHVCLRDQPRYTALSYAWGDPSITQDLILDGQRLQVTQNLASALDHLLAEHRDHGEGAIVLWVDAVCIDQRNEVEKNHQVSQMGTIFHTAERTLVWLGPASADSDLAVQTLRELSPLAHRLQRLHVRSWSSVAFDATTSDPTVQAIQDALDAVLVALRVGDSARLRAVGALYERPWFRRVWVLQERVLARSCVLYCGPEGIAWDTFYEGFWLLCGLRDYVNLVGSGRHGGGSGRQDSAALAAFLTEALDRVTPVAFTPFCRSLMKLFSLLARMAPRAQLQASDKRDYVYGLLSLVEPQSSPRIVIDYSKSWATVRKEVGEACLSYYGPRMLSFAGSGSFSELDADAEAQKVPSWAPDWSSPYLAEPLYTPSIFILRRNIPSPYSASKRWSQGPLSVFTADGRMDIKALHVDDITYLGQPFLEAGEFTDDTTRVASLSAWLRDLDIILPRPNMVYGSEEEVNEALWRTPIANRAYVHNWETGDASAETYWAYQAVRANDVGRAIKYANIAYSKLFRRRPFRTAKGYIGLGPLRVCEGDSIWILPGADVPFVFRPTGHGSFTVIGEAYVHGIMRGELCETQTVTRLPVISLV